MITEDYVSFEVAKLLKEKGFVETSKTIGTYNNKGEFFLYGHENGYNHNRLHTWYSAPTLQFAMKWLRDLYNIYIIVEPHLFKEKKATEYCFNYWIDEHYHMPYDESYPVYHPFYAKTWGSYEEACEAAIKYCVEHLI